MSEPTWPDWTDEAIRVVRYGRETDFWQSAERVVNTLPPEQLTWYATVGLAELATQSYKLDRDPDEPCIGHQIAQEFLRRRFPELAEEPGDADE